MATAQKTRNHVRSEEEEESQAWTPREEKNIEEEETIWTEPEWTECAPLFTPKTHDQQQLPDGPSEWTCVYCSEDPTQEQEEYLTDQRWKAMKTFAEDQHATQPQAIFLDGNYRMYLVCNYCGRCYHADCEGGEPASIMCSEVLCEWCAEDKD